MVWHAWWRELAVMTSRHYDAPSGRVGRRFVRTLGDNQRGVQDRLWNSERLIVFQMVILQQSRHITASHTIRRRIEKRLDAWGEGKHAMLVKDTLCTCAEYLTVARREETKDHRAQKFYSLVLRGKLRIAVRWITEREAGRVLQPGDWCTKTGDQVAEVLRSKRPEARTPTAASLDLYPDCPPELTPVNITDETVTVVTGRLLGGSGPGGTDSFSL